MKSNIKGKVIIDGKSKHFPSLTLTLNPRELIKIVVDDKSSTLVSNDQAVEFLYNQWVEGKKKVRIVLPDGKTINHEVKEDREAREAEQEREMEELIKGDLRDPTVPDKTEDGRPIPPFLRMKTRRLMPEDK